MRDRDVDDVAAILDTRKVLGAEHSVRDVLAVATPHAGSVVDDQAVLELDPVMDRHDGFAVDEQLSGLGEMRDLGLSQGERDHPRHAVAFEREVREHLQARPQLLLAVHGGTYSAKALLVAASGVRRVLPRVDRTFAERTFAVATVTLGDERADEDEREDAALIIGTLLRNGCLCLTEAELADLFCALTGALDVYLAVRRVLDGVRGLRPPQVVERAGYGVERLMDRAYRDGEHDALGKLVDAALDEPLWAPRVRDEWGKAAFIYAVNHVPETKYRAAFLVSGWLHAFGRVPDWMAEIAEAYPDLVASTHVPREVRWRLHMAAPTVQGWKTLASALGRTPTIDPALFGHTVDVAVTTLEVAIGETADEKTKSVLRSWLHELTGMAR